jgi:hypothetical protein
MNATMAPPMMRRVHTIRGADEKHQVEENQRIDPAAQNGQEVL